MKRLTKKLLPGLAILAMGIGYVYVNTISTPSWVDVSTGVIRSCVQVGVGNGVCHAVSDPSDTTYMPLPNFLGGSYHTYTSPLGACAVLVSADNNSWDSETLCGDTVLNTAEEMHKAYPGM